MKLNRCAPLAFCTALLGGCGPMAAPPAPAPSSGSYEARRPALPPEPARPAASGDRAIPPDRQAHPRDTAETAADRRFANFLRETAGGMIRQSTVGLEANGRLRVQITRAVEPDEVLDLTKGILTGARRDFPDKPLNIWLYDPDGQAILRANYRPGRGVHYDLVGAGDAAPVAGRADDTASANPLAHAGTTERDRRFAEWAEGKGRKLLRYVQADVERRGRLWFGVTREVKPEDVRDLTRSLLEGARAEFPDREIVATVFDPDGGRIGRAHLGRDGKVRWEE